MTINGNEHIQVIKNYVGEFMQKIKGVPNDELEKQFDDLLGFYEDYSKFSLEEKIDLIKNDFIRLIFVIRDRYESVVDNRVLWSASVEDFDKALQVIIEPMKNGDVFFYSQALQEYRKGQQVNRHIFNQGVKFPKDIVEELEAKEAEKHC